MAAVALYSPAAVVIMGTTSGFSFGSSGVDPSLDQLFSTSRTTGVPKRHTPERPRKRVKVGAQEAKHARTTSSDTSPESGSDSDNEDARDEIMGSANEDDLDLELGDQPVSQIDERKKKKA